MRIRRRLAQLALFMIALPLVGWVLEELARRAGTQGATCRTGSGWSWRWALATRAGEPRGNGGWPHSSSYSTAPSEYTSEAGVAGWPATRSGET